MSSPAGKAVIGGIAAFASRKPWTAAGSDDPVPPKHDVPGQGTHHLVSCHRVHEPEERWASRRSTSASETPKTAWASTITPRRDFLSSSGQG